VKWASDEEGVSAREGVGNEGVCSQWKDEDRTAVALALLFNLQRL